MLHFEDAPEDAAFRAELRAWLEEHATPKTPEQRLASFGTIVSAEDDPGWVNRSKVWQHTLAAGGWAAITWPRAWGGRDATPVQAWIHAEELAVYDVPQGLYTIGLGMIGPTLLTHGTEAQKRRWLPAMLDGSEVWCQLWSEPDAGSDVASLRTLATPDPETGGWRLAGQKIWTSGAQHARWGLVIARSDPDAPKHRGISCFVVDMHQPGVTLRPLRQLTGGTTFNEVFFDGTAVPPDQLVGALHDGWRVALTTLANERYSVGALAQQMAPEPLLALARSWTVDGRGASADPLLRQDLARVYTTARLLVLTNARSMSRIAHGGVPGPEGSVVKLAWAQLSTLLAAAALRALGPHGQLAGDDEPVPGRWLTAFLYAPANHLAGGTDEIQRTIIGERVLGLPREPDA
ncbi:MAG: acyl-CoA dehydrogenase family protein [Acidimicrobiia bacterium]